jgi:hypothetical protein
MQASPALVVMEEACHASNYKWLRALLATALSCFAIKRVQLILVSFLGQAAHAASPILTVMEEACHATNYQSGFGRCLRQPLVAVKLKPNVASYTGSVRL